MRTDIPRKNLEVNFDFLQKKLKDQENFADLFGFTTLNVGSEESAIYKYSITELGVKLGTTSWHIAHRLMESLRFKTGIDFKKQDSIYCKVNKNNNTVYRSYSDDMLELLKKMQGEENYNPSWIDSEFLKNAKK